MLLLALFLLSSASVFEGADYDTGFINVAPNTDYFYWLIESANEPATDPLVIFLGGGPGASSAFAAVGFNGPWLFNNASDPDDLTLKPNPNSWNKVANMLYVDQPAGVGFSTVDGLGYATTSEVIGALYYSFLVDFMKEYPMYRNRELYFTGDSFAGHYAPAIASYIN